MPRRGYREVHQSRDTCTEGHTAVMCAHKQYRDAHIFKMLLEGA